MLDPECSNKALQCAVDPCALCVVLIQPTQRCIIDAVDPVCSSMCVGLISRCTSGPLPLPRFHFLSSRICLLPLPPTFDTSVLTMHRLLPWLLLLLCHIPSAGTSILVMTNRWRLNDTESSPDILVVVAWSRIIPIPYHFDHEDDGLGSWAFDDLVLCTASCRQLCGVCT